jgi:hypothetical protein
MFAVEALVGAWLTLLPPRKVTADRDLAREICRSVVDLIPIAQRLSPHRKADQRGPNVRSCAFSELRDNVAAQEVA